MSTNNICVYGEKRKIISIAKSTLSRAYLISSLHESLITKKIILCKDRTLALNV